MVRLRDENNSFIIKLKNILALIYQMEITKWAKLYLSDVYANKIGYDFI